MNKPESITYDQYRAKRSVPVEPQENLEPFDAPTVAPVPRTLCELEDAIAQLYDRLSKLKEQLKPVSAPEAPGTVRAAVPSPGSSELSRRLSDGTDKLLAMKALVCDMTNALEI